MIEGTLIILTKYRLGSLSKIDTIIYKKEDSYFFLVDSSDKLKEVFNMPDYIKNDFIKYNSKDLELHHVDQFIREIEKNLNPSLRDRSMISALEDTYKENLYKLRALKREILIKNLFQ